MPYWPLMISPASSENQATPMPIARPATMLGMAPGITTCQRMAFLLAPRLRAARTSTSGVCSTPCTVFSTMGKKAPRKVMKTMLDCSVGSIRIASGIQATAGIGRNSSMYGRMMSSAQRERPIITPVSTPNTTA